MNRAAMVAKPRALAAEQGAALKWATYIANKLPKRERESLLRYARQRAQLTEQLRRAR